MKQPIIIMSNESLEDNEKQTSFFKEKQARSIMCKSFLLGTSIGFALQAMAFAASHTHFKMFREDPKLTQEEEEGSLLSSFCYCRVLKIQLDVAIYGTIWLALLHPRTKSGSFLVQGCCKSQLWIQLERTEDVVYCWSLFPRWRYCWIRLSLDDCGFAHRNGDSIDAIFQPHVD
jgi:hypothetical protein